MAPCLPSAPRSIAVAAAAIAGPKIAQAPLEEDRHCAHAAPRTVQEVTMIRKVCNLIRKVFNFAYHVTIFMMWPDVLVTCSHHAVESRFPRAHIDLARRGAWSAAIRHAPRVLGGAVGTKGRAQLIKGTFCMGVILTSAFGSWQRCV